MTLEEFKKDMVKEFLENWSRSFKNLANAPDEAIWTGFVLKNFEIGIKNNIKQFIEDVVEKSFEKGVKETIEVISQDQGWEESEKFYKEKLLKKQTL
jgi:hypothetical protein